MIDDDNSGTAGAYNFREIVSYDEYIKVVRPAPRTFGDEVKAAVAKLFDDARFRDFFYSTKRGVYRMGASWADRAQVARMAYEQAVETNPEGAVATMLTASGEPDLARIHRVLSSGVKPKIGATERQQREARKLLQQRAAE